MRGRALATGLGVLLAFVLVPPSAVALDDGLENPNSCTNPFGGNDSPEGSAIVVPGGLPMPTGTPPPLPSSTPGAPYPPPQSVYVCVRGGWVPIASANVAGLLLEPESPAVSGAEGSTITLAGTYAYAGEAPVTLSASIGSATAFGDGTWAWSMTPDDGPWTGTVLVTGTAGESTSTAAFDVTVTNAAPTVTALEPLAELALVGQSVPFAGAATDPSAADTTAGFSWSFEAAPVTFDACGTHTITGTATDKDGAESVPSVSAPIDVVEAAYANPLVAGARNVVRPGQVVPVRMAIGCEGSSFAGLAPVIRLVTGDVDPATTTEDPALLVPSVEANGETSGVMRQVGDSYLYNLRVPRATPGSVFTVRVSPLAGAGTADVVLEVR